jgi:hypothetical protein
MKKIKYIGNRRKGTPVPRRVWSPGEELLVHDEVAEALLEDSEFEIIKKRGGSLK